MLWHYNRVIIKNNCMLKDYYYNSTISTWRYKRYIDYNNYIELVNKYDTNSLSNILYIH